MLESNQKLFREFNPITVDVASSTVSELLASMQLNELRIFNAVVILCFCRCDAHPALPQQIWLHISGGISLESADSPPGQTRVFALDHLLPSLYKLIGSNVEYAVIVDNEKLNLVFSNVTMRVCKTSSSLAEVWAVMSDSPVIPLPHQWYIACSNTGGIFGVIPTAN